MTAWFSIILSLVLTVQGAQDASAVLSGIGIMFSFYTIQSNLIVATWLTLAIIFNNKEEKPSIVSSPVQGAITLYISVTFIIFALLLSGMYKPTGWEALTNITMHYLIPIAVIIDWLITGMEVKYEWKYCIYWAFYPFGYLFYTLIQGLLTGFYPYYFLDFSLLLIPGYFISVGLISVFFFLLSCFYIFINRTLFERK